MINIFNGTDATRIRLRKHELYIIKFVLYAMDQEQLTLKLLNFLHKTALIHVNS